MSGAPGRSTSTSDWRRLTLVFAVTGFIETVGFGHYVSFLPLLVSHLGAAPDDVGTLVGVLSAASFVAGLPLVPFWGVWADKFSRKAIVVRSAAVEAILFLAIAQVSAVWQLFLLVPLIGLVLGNTGVMLAELTDVTPSRRLGLAISLVGTASPLGFAVGPAVGGVLADRFGVQPLFLVDALLSAGIVILLMATFHERADRPRSGQPVLAMVRRALGAVFQEPLARGILAGYFLLLFGQRFLAPYLALYVRELHGPAQLATLVGFVAAGYGIAAGLGSPVAGLLGDRFGHRRVFVVGVLAAAACLLLAAAAPGLASFAIVYAAFGVGFAGASSMLFTLLASGLPQAIRSAVLNLSLAPLYLSGILGSLGSAALLGVTGGELRPIWVVAAATMSLALVPVLRLRAPAAAPLEAAPGASGGSTRVA